MTMTKPKLLVSACLLGENCKYSGGNNRMNRCGRWNDIFS